MDFILLFLVGILSVSNFGISAPVGKSLCDKRLFDICKPEGFQIQGDGSSYLLTEDVPDVQCSDRLEDLECMKNYLSTCPFYRSHFGLAIVEGFLDVFRDVCNDTTDISRDLRKHSPCLAKTIADYKECSLSYINYFYGKYYYSSEGSFIHGMCRLYHPHKLCITQATRKTCGDSAAQYVEQTYARMAAPFVNSKCSNKVG